MLRSGLISVPNHIGVIMDGNRMWADKNNLDIIDAYKIGLQVIKSTCLHCLDLGVSNLTLLADPLENTLYSDEQKRVMINLLLIMFGDKYWFISNNIRVYFAGKMNILSEERQAILCELSESTACCSGMNITIALNYDGHEEIINAFKHLVDKSDTLISVTKKEVEQHLYTSHLPPLDLIIRTANIKRLSKFLLWKSSYAELVFCKKCWPEFNHEDLQEAINEYKKRDRRYGK